jgi:hypothetical protein
MGLFTVTAETVAVFTCAIFRAALITPADGLIVLGLKNSFRPIHKVFVK